MDVPHNREDQFSRCTFSHLSSAVLIGKFLKLHPRGDPDSNYNGIARLELHHLVFKPSPYHQKQSRNGNRPSNEGLRSPLQRSSKYFNFYRRTIIFNNINLLRSIAWCLIICSIGDQNSGICWNFEYFIELASYYLGRTEGQLVITCENCDFILSSPRSSRSNDRWWLLPKWRLYPTLLGQQYPVLAAKVALRPITGSWFRL